MLGNANENPDDDDVADAPVVVDDGNANEKDDVDDAPLLLAGLLKLKLRLNAIRARA